MKIAANLFFCLIVFLFDDSVDHGYSSSTPVTDGKRPFVQFGKWGLFAFDTSGKQVWSTNVGTKTDPAKWGDGASCVLDQDLVLVNADYCPGRRSR